MTLLEALDDVSVVPPINGSFPPGAENAHAYHGLRRIRIAASRRRIVRCLGHQRRFFFLGVRHQRTVSHVTILFVFWDADLVVWREKPDCIVFLLAKHA